MDQFLLLTPQEANLRRAVYTNPAYIESVFILEYLREAQIVNLTYINLNVVVPDDVVNYITDIFKYEVTSTPEGVGFKRVTKIQWDNIALIPATTLYSADIIAGLGFTPQGILISGTNIKTINGNNILGSGDIITTNAVAWGGITGLITAQTDLITALALKANLISPSFTTPVIGVATGTSLTVTGPISSSGAGIGYVTGAGGTVTQLTSRTTTVINNKLCGNITMFSAAQAANALVSFTLTNSFIAATDYLLVQHISATNGGAWVFSTVCGAGSAVIHIRNQTTASITEATPLRFFILKAVTS